MKPSSPSEASSERKQFLFAGDWGLFLGAFAGNREHEHVALQLSISLGPTIRLHGPSGLFESPAVLIKGAVPHALECDGAHMLLLFHPISTTGHYLNQWTEEEMGEFEGEVVEELRGIGLAYLKGEVELATLQERIETCLEAFRCTCREAHSLGDHRIMEALELLDRQFERSVSLEEAAAHVHLSPSRFLHLFKIHTGLTFRKAQQWNKLRRSLPSLSKQSVTETAHEFGFSDSAHYARVFKEAFGFSPKFISKT